MHIESFLSKEARKLIASARFTSQSIEVSNLSPKINATAGVFMKDNSLVTKKAVLDFYVDKSPEDIVAYSPSLGLSFVRNLWKEKVSKKESIPLEAISLPIVTPGISAALFLAGQLTVSSDSVIFYPQMHWEAYDNIFKNNLHPLDYVSYDSYLSTLSFEELNNSLGKATRFILIINYPNNPTGWCPDREEVKILIRSLLKIAESGRKVIVIIDDAYEGLSFEFEFQSLFSELYNLHENILAIKCDGASKENLMWGQRIGFLTFGAKGASKEDFSFIESKVEALIRGTWSSACTLSQHALLAVESSKSSSQEDSQLKDCLKARFKQFRKTIEKLGARDFIKPLPFNSGYFMCFEVACNADILRENLLHKRNIGIISYDSHHIRIAWSSVDINNIEELLLSIYKEAEIIFNECS